MSKSAYDNLPESWCFDSVCENQRAEQLKAVGSSEELTEELHLAVKNNFEAGDARLGWERSGDPRGGYRAVLQFKVSDLVFDWFFNARSGYRAHFQQSYLVGLGFNLMVIETLRYYLVTRLPKTINARRLCSDFSDEGQVKIRKGRFVNSIGHASAKISYCTKLITGDGAIKNLPTGVPGSPKILLADNRQWPMISRNTDDTWMDIKGAFSSNDGTLYQIKCPLCRAKNYTPKGHFESGSSLP